MSKKNILDYSLESLDSLMKELNESSYRSKQLFSWIYKKKVFDINEMSDLSKQFRNNLNENFEIKLPQIETHQTSFDKSVKLLLKLEDNNMIETVLMPYDYGNAVCVTSQVGCNMGCKFCASGQLRKIRNLTAGEMISQVLVMEEFMKDKEENFKVSHVVIMGIGEPLDNYDEVMEFIKIVNSPFGLEIGARKISLSTSGIIPKINMLANENINFNLAISLHAPNNKIRNEIMPINKGYPIEELMKSVDSYIHKTNRRVNIEYLLLSGVNDSIDNARELTKLLKNRLVYINLIPYNEVSGSNYKRPNKNKIFAFYNELKKNNLNVTIRKEFGHDIDGACGQLRAKKEGNL